MGNDNTGLRWTPARALPPRPLPDKVPAAERVPTDLEILRRVRDGLARLA